MDNKFKKVVTGREYSVWPEHYTRIAIVFALVLISFISLIFNSYIMPPFILAVGIVIILFFFLGLQYYSRFWSRIELKTFDKRLFLHSMFYRIVFIVLLYLLSYFYDPANFPFEINAVDSWLYHRASAQMAKLFFSGNAVDVGLYYFKTSADLGFPMYMAILYYIFGPQTIVVRIMNALWGSLTAVYVSRITRSIFGDAPGRLAGILTMLMPSLMWYSGMHLKESLMIFLVIAVMYHAIKIIQEGKINIASLVIMVLFTFSLFYFRTFLAMLVLVSVLVYFLLNFSKTKINRGLIFVSFMIFVVVMSNLITTLGFDQVISSNLDESEGRFDHELHYAAKQRGVNYQRALVSPFILVGAAVTPFPSLLDFEKRQLGIYMKFQNELTRNMMYFFSFMGLIYAIRNAFRKSSALLLFTFGYILILVIAAVSFQDRFQLPVLPFMIIFMSVGFSYGKRPITNKWFFYLALIFAAVFSWNFFKLSIRGLV